MATVVTSVIHKDGGAGVDYTSAQAWEDALPTDLVTDDEQHVGECKSGHFETVAGTVLTVSGQTTDATRNIIFTVEAGASIVDDDTVLQYDESGGVYFRNTGSYSDCISIQTSHTEVRRIQHSASKAAGMDISAASCLVESCLGEMRSANNNAYCYDCASASTLVNSFGYLDHTGSQGAAFRVTNNSAKAVNCTAVVSSGVTGAAAGIFVNYARPDIINCAAFNFGTAFRKNGGSGWSAGSDYNATDAATATGGTNDQTSLTYADQFEDPNTTGGADFRLKSGSDLIGAATRRQTETNDLDIFGNARDTSTPDIGCHELQAAAASTILPQMMQAHGG